MNVKECNNVACDNKIDRLSSIMSPSSNGQIQWSDEDQDGKGTITNITVRSCHPTIPIRYTHGKSTNFLHKFTITRCDGSKCTHSATATTSSLVSRSVCGKENTNVTTIMIGNEF